MEHSGMEHTIDGYHTLSDGHRLYWRVDDFTDPWKEAPTVLLIHGFAETSEAWRAWVPHLARDCRVLRIDRRGFGKSDPMPVDFPWSLDRMVDDTVSFIEAHAAEGTHIIGCKIATPLSIRLAVRRPDLVKSLVLCGGPATAPNGEAWARQIEERGAKDWAASTMDARMGPEMPAVAKTWWRSTSAPRSAASDVRRWWLRPTAPIGRSRKSLHGKAGFRIRGSPRSRAAAFTPPRSRLISARRRRWPSCARSIEARRLRPRRREDAWRMLVLHSSCRGQLLYCAPLDQPEPELDLKGSRRNKAI